MVGPVFHLMSLRVFSGFIPSSKRHVISFSGLIGEIVLRSDSEWSSVCTCGPALDYLPEVSWDRLHPPHSCPEIIAPKLGHEPTTLSLSLSCCTN